jgi:hypothetical protein
MLENMALVLILLRVMGGGFPPSGVGLFVPIFCYAKGFPLQSLTRIKSDMGRTLGEIKISPLVHLLTATMTNLALMKGEKHMGSLKWRQYELRPP